MSASTQPAGPWTKYSSQPAAGPWTKYASAGAPAGTKQSRQLAGGALGDAESLAAGAGEGMGDLALGAQQLAGKIMSGAGSLGPKDNALIHSGDWLQADAQQGVKKLADETAPYRQAHPWVTAGGKLIPQATAGIATGGALGMAGSIGSRIASGAISSGLVGALNPIPEGEKFWWTKGKEALENTVIGGAGSAVAEGAAAGIRNAFTPTADKLMAGGVKLTPGQAMGGIAKRAEDALTSVPFVGSVIRSGQNKALESFNEAAINHALAPIGEKLTGAKAGHEAIDEAATKLSQAYEKLLPQIHGEIDKDFADDIADINKMGTSLPLAQRQQLGSIITNDILNKFTPQGRTTGHTVKEIESTLGRLSSGYMRSPDYDQARLGGALKELQASLRNMVERVNPGAKTQLSQINAGWAALLRVQRAAASVGAPDGKFTPAQLLNAVKALDASRSKASFAKGKALMQDFAKAAKSVLPSKVPDSGTAERLQWDSILGPLAIGGGAFATHSLVAPLIAATLAAPYSRAGMGALSKFGAQPVRNALADLLTGASRLSGPTAAGAFQQGYDRK